MKTALSTSVILLSASIISFLIATVSIRFVRTIREKRLVAIQIDLRRVLIKLVSGDLPSATLAQAIKFKTIHFDELSEAMVSKIKGEARESLVDFLEARGAVDGAISRTYRLGAMKRCKAASFLGNCGIKRSRLALERLLDNRNPEVRSTAIRALGLVGDPRSVEALLTRLDRDRKALPFGMVLVALNRIGSVGNRQVRNGLDGEGEWQRAATVELLGLQGVIEAVPALVEHLSSDLSFEVRIRCARALGRIGSPRATQKLIDSLSPEVPLGLRVVSCGALGLMGDPRSVVPIARFLNENNQSMSRAAANALAQIGGGGIAALKACVAADGFGAGHAIEALARSDIKENAKELNSRKAIV